MVISSRPEQSRSVQWRGTWLLPLVIGLAAGLAPFSVIAAGDDATAIAADADATATLTRPSSVLEFGVGVGRGGALPGIGVDALGAINHGLSGIGNFDLRGAQYSYLNPEDDMTRWRLTGNNLGLHWPSLFAEYGQQGGYRATLTYVGMRHLTSDSYQTPLLGAGTSLLYLPAGFVAGATTGAMPKLQASMHGQNLQTTRRRLGLDLRYWLDREWELRLRLYNDALDGSRLRGAEFGSNGGNARAMLLAEPIDSATQRVDASLAYAGEGRRFVLSYHGSVFRNHIDSLTWQNPYTNAAWVGGRSSLPVGFPLTLGRLAVAPDNDFHQVSLNGSYDLSTTSRLTLSGARGRMTQNVAFLPYTVNPGLAVLPLPRRSLEGRIETRFLLARLSMRPMRRLSMAASLRYDDRDNKTPRSEFNAVAGDIALQPAAQAASDHIRTNLARSRQLLKWSLEADYRLPGGRAAHAGWERETIRRTFSEVARATENTYRVELRQGGAGPWTGSAGVARLIRRGSQYLYNLPFLSSYSSAAFTDGLALANGCPDLLQCVRLGPLQQKFFLADRDRGRARVQVGYAPDGPFSLQARLEVHRDRYPRGDYGVVGANGWTTGADLTVAFSEDVQGTLFHVLENQTTRERSRQVSVGAPLGTGDTSSDWMNRFSDRTNTLGVGMRYQRLLGGKLDLDLDLVAVYGRSPVRTTVGTSVSAAQNPAGPFPDIRFQSESLGMTARFAASRNETVKFQYLFRRIRQVDWATQAVGADTLSNLIGIGEVPTRRTVHGFGITYVVRFR